jgi:hypothetical protein
VTYHAARDRLLAAAGYPGPSNAEFFEALSEWEQAIRLEERAVHSTQSRRCGACGYTCCCAGRVFPHEERARTP